MNSQEIDHAMKHRLPVMCEGIQHTRITEYVSWYDNKGNRRFSVGLLDKNGKSVVRVPAEKVRMLET